jgi:hypothetical protein
MATKPFPVRITSWSHSKLSDFEKCKFLAKLKHLDRVPEPERPLPPGKTEHANDRGTRVHTHAENYVNGTLPAQISEMQKFAGEFEQLRHLHGKGLVSLEGEWAMDTDWAPTDWRTGWHRSKVDAIVFPSKYEAIVIDYKTGKKFGNEIKHAEQTQLYALNAVLRYPDLEEVTTELWYLDQDQLTSAKFMRSQILRFKTNWDRRGHALTSCDVFPPNPNIYTCKWCQYGPWNGGQCSVGVQA